MTHAEETVKKVQKLYALLHEVRTALGRYAPDAQEGAREFHDSWIIAEEDLRNVIHPAELQAAEEVKRMTDRYKYGDMGARIVQALDDLLGVATGTLDYIGDRKAATDLLEHPNGEGEDEEVTVDFRGTTLWDLWPDDDDYYVGDWNGRNENLVWLLEINGETHYLLGTTNHYDPFHLLSRSQAERFLHRAAEVVQETPADDEE